MLNYSHVANTAQYDLYDGKTLVAIAYKNVDVFTADVLVNGITTTITSPTMKGLKIAVMTKLAEQIPAPVAGVIVAAALPDTMYIVDAIASADEPRPVDLEVVGTGDTRDLAEMDVEVALLS